VQEWRWGEQGGWMGCVQSAAGASSAAAWVALKRPRAPKCVAAPTIVGAGIIIRRSSSVAVLVVHVFRDLNSHHYDRRPAH
jgi:hypothetical protein